MWRYTAVYVYDLPAQFHSQLAKEQRRCIYDQYGTEIRIHETLLRSPMRTTNPLEAEFFFVPIYVGLLRCIAPRGCQIGATRPRYWLSSLGCVLD